VNQGKVHPADEANFLRLADQRGEPANQERPLFFAKLERGQVVRRQNRIAGGIGADGVIDPREVRVRLFPGELRKIVGKDESDTDHEVHSFCGEQAQTRLSVRAVPWLDETNLCAELAFGALSAEICAVVEGLVPSSAEIEDDPHVDRIPGWGLLRPRRPHEQQGDVCDEQHRQYGQ
jgi:hypothetical protein